jgi:hypothetical protein
VPAIEASLGMSLTLLALLLATAPTTTPKHLTLGFDTTARFEPGGGFAGFVGFDFMRISARLRVGVDSADQSLSYCLEKCGVAGDPPLRSPRQHLATVGLDFRWMALTIGPFSPQIGMRTSVLASTSPGFSDPVAWGVETAWLLGTALALPHNWRADVVAMAVNDAYLFVPDAPSTGQAVGLGVNVAFVYTFSD